MKLISYGYEVNFNTVLKLTSYNHFINTLFAGNQMIICLLFSSGTIFELKDEVDRLSELTFSWLPN